MIIIDLCFDKDFKFINIFSSVSLSKADVASSNINIFGFDINALAIPILCL